MFDSGLATVTMFFVIIGIALVFVVAWILKSEARVGVCKNQINKLKADLESSERERFLLAEKSAGLEAAKGQEGAADAQGKDTSLLENSLAEALEKADVLKAENKKLKKELSEAKSSLEEVYKALK